MKNARKIAIGTVSVLGAIGSALQNVIGFGSWMLDLSSRIATPVVHTVSGVLGGITGVVNLCVNIDLLYHFSKRFSKSHPKPVLEGSWTKFRYYGGSLIFIGTGLLFGATAFAITSSGILSQIGIAAGVLVALIMMVQELETWLASFDPKKIKAAKIIENPKARKAGRTLGKIISLCNVVGLSLLFAFGIASVLVNLSVPLLPSIITSLVIAFTAGAFTEYYFYNSFLSKFCSKLVKKWNQLINSKYSYIGIGCILINAVVNGVLCYYGIVSFGTSMLAQVGMATVPLSVVIIASIFVALASTLLTASFWIKVVSKQLPEAKGYKKVKAEDEQPQTVYSSEKKSPANKKLSRTPTIIDADKSKNSGEGFLGVFRKSASTNRKKPVVKLTGSDLAQPSIAAIQGLDHYHPAAALSPA